MNAVIQDTKTSLFFSNVTPRETNSSTEVGAVVEPTVDSSMGFAVFRSSVISEGWLPTFHTTSPNALSRP